MHKHQIHHDALQQTAEIGNRTQTGLPSIQLICNVPLANIPGMPNLSIQILSNKCCSILTNTLYPRAYPIHIMLSIPILLA